MKRCSVLHGKAIKQVKRAKMRPLKVIAAAIEDPDTSNKPKSPIYMLSKTQCKSIMEDSIQLTKGHFLLSANDTIHQNPNVSFEHMHLHAFDRSFGIVTDSEGYLDHFIHMEVNRNIWFTVDVNDTVFKEGESFVQFVGHTEQSDPKYSGICLIGCTHSFAATEGCHLNFDTQTIVEKFRPNLVASGGKKHFGSRGYCFGHGTRAQYSIDIDGRSFGNYVNRKQAFSPGAVGQVDATTYQAVMDKGEMFLQEALASLQLKIGTGNIERDVGLVTKTLINYVDDVNCIPAKTSFCSMYLNANASTDLAHNENDINWTIIGVPPQHYSEHTSGKLQWEYCPTSIPIRIPMHCGQIMYYSGLFLRHRQDCQGCDKALAQDKGKGTEMWNWSAYSNRRLDINMRKTYQRLQETLIPKTYYRKLCTKKIQKKQGKNCIVEDDDTKYLLL